MDDHLHNEYAPDTVSPPGDSLLETIQALGMSQAKLALRTGRPRKTINEIVKGKAAITAETALQLERVLRIPARFWLNRERRYREYLAREEDRARLAASVDWLDRFPVGEMVRRGWLEGHSDKVRQVQALLGFLGVASPAQWEQTWATRQVAFRRAKTRTSDPGALAAWLRQGEILAEALDCGPFMREGFEDALADARALTRKPPEEFQQELARLCAASGVAVVLVPQLSGTRANGATCWLSPTKALIQLSLRYRWEDVFWFSFFHEAGHILKHGKRDVFIDTGKAEHEDDREADGYARDALIAPATWRAFTGSGKPTKARIEDFALRVGVSAAIVVGRLQHEGLLPHSHCNDLRRRFAWAD